MFPLWYTFCQIGDFIQIHLFIWRVKKQLGHSTIKPVPGEVTCVKGSKRAHSIRMGDGSTERWKRASKNWPLSSELALSKTYLKITFCISQGWTLPLNYNILTNKTACTKSSMPKVNVYFLIYYFYFICDDGNTSM